MYICACSKIARVCLSRVYGVRAHGIIIIIIRYAGAPRVYTRSADDEHDGRRIFSKKEEL